MRLEIYWMGPIDPETGLPSSEGGVYNIRSLNFNPEIDPTGSSIPINEYTADLVTTDDIPVDALNCQLKDERNFMWVSWPLRKVERIDENVLRVTASSWVYWLEHETVEAMVYTGETAINAIQACVGDKWSNFRVSAALDDVRLYGYAPQQTARERLTWIIFSIGGYVRDAFTDRADIIPVDSTQWIIPMRRIYQTPAVNATDWVTAIKITSYTFRQAQSEEEWENDDNSFAFPMPWIAVPKSYTMENTLAPADAPENTIEVKDVYMVHENNVYDIAARLASYYFYNAVVSLDIINNRMYKPGDVVTVYTSQTDMMTGLIKSANFKFGFQAASTLKLVGAHRQAKREGVDSPEFFYVEGDSIRVSTRMGLFYQYSVTSGDGPFYKFAIREVIDDDHWTMLPVMCSPSTFRVMLTTKDGEEQVQARTYTQNGETVYYVYDDDIGFDNFYSPSVDAPFNKDLFWHTAKIIAWIVCYGNPISPIGELTPDVIELDEGIDVEIEG